MHQSFCRFEDWTSFTQMFMFAFVCICELKLDCNLKWHQRWDDNLEFDLKELRSPKISDSNTVSN